MRRTMDRPATQLRWC
uniref:Uncharacterized protein n=1 Tax=Arundo donax TaxID=35708 RepID=A0A0A9FG24_ARUDO